jgi:hypothetical protein
VAADKKNASTQNRRVVIGDSPALSYLTRSLSNDKRGDYHRQHTNTLSQKANEILSTQNWAGWVGWTWWEAASPCAKKSISSSQKYPLMTQA